MKLYFASPSNSDFFLLKTFGVERMLFSYHYLAKMQKRDYSKYLKVNDVFLDSGAFSAKNLGVEIDFDAYVKFIQDHEVEIYAGLDVIGDGEATMVNTQKMMKLGLKPLHTFHKGEHVDWLHRALDLDLPYIAIGGMVGIATNKADMIAWLDKVWAIILEKRPDIKVHGFACTSYDIMERYPWYSVDSTTWNVARKFGEGFDVRGKRKSKHKIMEDFKGIPYFQYMDEGSKLVVNTVITMLEWETQINAKHDNNDWNYIGSQQTLFDL